MLTFPLNYQLKDNTFVTVSIVGNNSFDFNMVLPNGTKRTFRWRKTLPHSFLDRYGKTDKNMKETIEVFLNKIRGQRIDPLA